MGGEPLTMGGQPRTGPVAHEQAAAQLTFQVMNAGGHRGLGDVQPFGGGHETASANDLQKGAGQIDVHN